jgi:hypothetical protein
MDRGVQALKISYEQAYADHCYLWETYGSANDMTGAYVDQQDLAKLLKSPTKATARACLVEQISYWFEAGPDTHHGTPIDRDDPMLIEIAERHDLDIP